MLTVISKVAVQNRSQHQRFVQQRVDPILVGLNPYNTVLRE